MSSLEELRRRPGYPYVATNPNVPSHLSPVMQIVSRDEILHEDGSWREGNPIYMTSQPTGSSRASQPSLPREATKRKNLQEKHPSDWRNHHRLEIDGEKLELRNVDGRAVYKQAPLTEADKRQRLSSTYIGYTNKTKAEREAIGLLIHLWRPYKHVLNILQVKKQSNPSSHSLTIPWTPMLNVKVLQEL